MRHLHCVAPDLERLPLAPNHDINTYTTVSRTKNTDSITRHDWKTNKAVFVNF